MLSIDILYKIVNNNRKLYYPLLLTNKEINRELLAYKFMYLRKIKKENEGAFKNFVSKITNQSNEKHREIARELIENDLLSLVQINTIMISNIIYESLEMVHFLLNTKFYDQMINLLEKNNCYLYDANKLKMRSILEFSAEIGKSIAVFEAILNKIDNKVIDTKKGKKTINNVIKILIEKRKIDFFSILIEKVDIKLINLLRIPKIITHTANREFIENPQTFLPMELILNKRKSKKLLPKYRKFLFFLIREFNLQGKEDFLEKIFRESENENTEKRNKLFYDCIINSIGSYDNYNLDNLKIIFKIMKNLNIKIEKVISYKDFFDWDIYDDPEYKILDYILSAEYYDPKLLIRKRDILFLIENEAIIRLDLISKSGKVELVSNWDYIRAAIHKNCDYILKILIDVNTDINKVAREVIRKKKKGCYNILIENERFDPLIGNCKIIRYLIKMGKNEELAGIFVNDELEISYNDNLLLFKVIKELYRMKTLVSNIENNKIKITSLIEIGIMIVEHKKFQLYKIDEIIEDCMENDNCEIICEIIKRYMHNIKISEYCINYLFFKGEEEYNLIAEIFEKNLFRITNKFLKKYLSECLMLSYLQPPNNKVFEMLLNNNIIRNYIIRNNDEVVKNIQPKSSIVAYDEKYEDFIIELLERKVIKINFTQFKEFGILDSKFKKEWLNLENLDIYCKLEIALKLGEIEYVDNLIRKNIKK